MEKPVKITTLERILDIIYPCYCKGCGKIGTCFCSRCFFDNMEKNPPFFTLVDKDFQIVMACGMRNGILGQIIAEYKYLSRRQYSYVLAKYLNEVVKKFSSNEKYVIVPLPTISKHIRARGFDHMDRICRDFSSLSRLKTCLALVRANSAVQVGSDAKTRLKQAKEAYKINSRAILDPKSHYLLVDDVWTTGASMRAARDVLFEELMRLGAKKEAIKISAICLAKNDGYKF